MVPNFSKRNIICAHRIHMHILNLICYYNFGSIVDVVHCLPLMCRTMIQNMIKEGKIVPSEVTIRLIQRAMLENGNDKFLIDGFPRNEENRANFELVVSP